MPEVFVITREGETRRLDGSVGSSLMETIREAGIDEVLALCGGMCACGTCHVYLDPEFADLVPPISEDESAMLDGSGHRTDRSRLSCQIRLTEALSGLRVAVAPED